jgi:hypothetical protein
MRQVGKKNRVVGATMMNQDSSRSHSIFTVTIEATERFNAADAGTMPGCAQLKHHPHNGAHVPQSDTVGLGTAITIMAVAAHCA